LEREWLHETLTHLGFKPTEIQVYMFLAYNEPKTAKQIAESLSYSKQRVHRSINNLKDKECIKVVTKQANCYTVEPIDKVLRNHANMKNWEAQKLEQNKQAILKGWQSKIEGK
jgi:DNA-binding MarR family transcriptional regulator